MSIGCPSLLHSAPVILASQSPRRRALLKRILPEFEVTTATVDEWLDCAEGPKELALLNAKLKARQVATQYPRHWVIGSDTVVECEGIPLGKPESREQAVQMMQMLSGRKHNVHSGVVICHRGNEIEKTFVETSEVVFFRLSSAQIEAYVDTMHPGQYAGGYPIQYLMGTLVSGFDGSFTNVVGLPMERLQSELKALMLIPG